MVYRRISEPSSSQGFDGSRPQKMTVRRKGEKMVFCGSDERQNLVTVVVFLKQPDNESS